MNDAPTLLDTAYEYAGFQAAASFHGALAGLSIPLLFALAGIAYRFFRVAEDGAVRPLAFYVLSVFLVWWLGSPATSDAGALPHHRAPRALSILDAAADAIVRRAVEGVDREFLTRPFEWERLALIARVSRVQDRDLKENLRSFLEGCTRPAVIRLGSTPPDAVRRNALADDTGLDYARLVDGEGRSCESVRRDLLSALGREVERDPVHREALAALAAYSRDERGGLRALYLDKLVRNEWLRPEPAEGEFEAARRSVGTYRWYDADRRTMRYPLDGGRDFNTVWDLLNFPAGLVAEVVTGIYAETSQWLSEATEAKQRYYLVTTHAPHLYGLFLMLLMAFFPVAVLYALLPGKWTALLHFAKLFMAVKLWPFGWALLTGFTQRRPAVMALADAASDLRARVELDFRIGDTPNLFVTITLMYILVPALSFVVVQLVSHAASLPFQQAMPRPSGGNAASAAGQAAVAIVE
jgi:hypothetical protein